MFRNLELCYGIRIRDNSPDEDWELEEWISFEQVVAELSRMIETKTNGFHNLNRAILRRPRNPILSWRPKRQKIQNDQSRRSPGTRIKRCNSGETSRSDKEVPKWRLFCSEKLV